MSTDSYTIVRESVQDNDLISDLMAARRGELSAHRIEDLLEEVQGARSEIGTDDERNRETARLQEELDDAEQETKDLQASINAIKSALLVAERSIASGAATAEEAFAFVMWRIRETEGGFEAVDIQAAAE